MMSIGLIEALLQRPRSETTVTYFFCQNADYELNSIEAIIKGLIYQLLQQQDSAAKALRNRWDTANQRYIEDVTSWRGLWTIFGEMLEQCQTQRVYVVMDALDECQGDGMADLLRLIVRTGLGQPTRIKWLLTSRPLDSAERELLVGSEQVRVDLELNTQYVAQGIQFYTSYKIAELRRRLGAGLVQQHDIEEELRQKGEETFLWISHVCKRLENVDKDEMLSTIQTLPPDLDRFYHGMLIQLCEADTRITNGCIRLLKVMMLMHRPLDVREVSSVAGLLDDRQYIEAVVGRGAAFLKLRGTVVEFVHQSARDYLARAESHNLLDSRDQYGQSEIAISCCDHLIQHLKVNILNLPQWDATRNLIQDGGSDLFVSLGYAATFWFQHLNDARDHHPTHRVPTHDGKAEKLLGSYFLEWLECLSLMDQLPRAMDGLDALFDMTSYTAQSDSQPSLSDLIQDSRRFLSRHFSTISTWPLQAYNCAIIFSPAQSLVRQAYISCVPAWLNKLPMVENKWESLLQTLTGHSNSITSVKFSPDGQFIASGSYDKTIKLWNTKTGAVLHTLAFPSEVTTMTISPDGRFIASGHVDSTVRLWDTKTKLVTRTLADQTEWITVVEFSPDGQTIASGSYDRSIKLWDIKTGDMIRTLADQSLDRGLAIAFSPDGHLIALGSMDGTIQLWNIKIGTVVRTLSSHSSLVLAVRFSPDGQTIVSGSSDNTIKIWNIGMGSVTRTLSEHSNSVSAVTFLPDGETIVSGSEDKSIKLWNVKTGAMVRTLSGHSQMITALALSPDIRIIVSGDTKGIIKIWDIKTDIVEQPLVGHSKQIMDLDFSPDSRYLVSGSLDTTIKIWDIQTGLVLRTLVDRSQALYAAVAFSPAGQSIVSGSQWSIKIWDIETGVVVRTLTGDFMLVTAVAFSPDGHLIASGSDDKIVKIWNAKTGVELMTLTDHSISVEAVTFSPDGRYIASGSGNIIKIWAMKEVMHVPGQLTKIFRNRKKSRANPQEVAVSEIVWKLRFSADSRWLLANCGTSRVEMASLKEQKQEAWSSHELSVQSNWICCGSKRVIRLPGDDLITRYDVKDGQLAIGLVTGRIWTFTIDRERLIQSLNDEKKSERSQ